MFDQGYFDGTCIINNSNFVCKNSIPYTFIIPFNHPFQQIPQVFITVEHIGVYVKTDLRMEIKDITAQNFSLNVVCLVEWAHCLLLKWYAIDDQRFQIINAFNTINLTEQTYQHKNKNVDTEIGLINLISHNFDEFQFNLKIDKITSENVTVSLKKHLEIFHYQLMLGPKEGIQDFYFIDSLVDYEKQITERQNSWFITLYTGMGYPYTDAVRLNKTIQLQEASIFKYSLTTYLSAFTPCSHSHGFLIPSISSTLYFLNLQKLQVIQKSQLVSATSISINFLPKNQVLDTTGQFNITIDKDLTKILIDIYIVCPQGMLIQTNFEQCFNCSIKNSYKFNYQCSNQLKELVYNIQYSKQAPAYSELFINLQQNSCDMKQLLAFLFIFKIIQNMYTLKSKI